MSAYAAKYKIPPELDRFIDDGFVAFLGEDEAKKTVEFHIPSLTWTDDEERDTWFHLVWIHPDFNDQFCHYYDKKPGDLANFYLFEETDDVGDEWLDAENLDELIDWLQQRQESRARR